LLLFDSKFDATLLMFKLALEESIARNLSGITKGDLSSGLQLDLKRKGKTMLVTLHFTLHVEAIEFTQQELQKKLVVHIVHVAHYKVHTAPGGHKVQSPYTNCLVFTKICNVHNLTSQRKNKQ
jgi:hypothetical protein